MCVSYIESKRDLVSSVGTVGGVCRCTMVCWLGGMMCVSEEECACMCVCVCVCVCVACRVQWLHVCGCVLGGVCVGMYCVLCVV